MADSVNPYDIMRYERLVSEKLAKYSDWEEKYREYANRRDNNFSNTDFRSHHSFKDPNPLLKYIYATREEINRFFSGEQIRLSNHVVNLITIGRSLELLRETQLKNDNLEEIDEDVDDYYLGKSWNADDPWDMVFELEVAEMLYESGLSINLIKEDKKGGPDILLSWDNSTDLWIECKRKRTPEARLQHKNLKHDLLDSAFKQLSLGDDVYTVRVTGEELSESDIDSLSSAIAELVSENLGKTTVSTKDREFQVEKVFASQGSHEVQSSFNGGVLGPEKTSDISDFAEELGLKGLDYLCSGTVTHDGERTTISDALALEFQIPVNVDHEQWVMNTVKRARKDLSGHGPSVIFIDLPTTEWQNMHQTTTTDHRGNSVTFHERVKQRIIGVFNQSSSVNGVILTTKTQTPTGIARGLTPWWNESPENHVPDRLKAEIENILSN